MLGPSPPGRSQRVKEDKQPQIVHQSRVLQLGFAAILILILGSVAFSIVESSRSASATRRLLSDARETASLMGRTGQQVALLRATTAEALYPSGTAIDDNLGKIRSVQLGLNRALIALSGRLSAEQHDEWGDIGPLAIRFHQSVDAAWISHLAGDRVHAEHLLREGVATSAQLFDRLEELSRQGDRELEAAMQEAEQRAALARRLEAAVGLALLLCTLAVAASVWRLVKSSQRELSAYIGRVESSNHDLEAFAGRVAHDLKNVLNPLQVAGPLLQQSASESDVVSAVGARIERVTRRAVDILEGLLCFARAGAPPSEDCRTPVDQELSAVLEELEPIARQVDAKTRVSVEPSLAVRCASSLLHVVLLNVLSNALKFLQGRDAREVRIDGRQEGSRCVIDVVDTGPGIPKRALQRIFEPFFRVQGVRVAGSGIGLATVRRIVDAHHGSIDVRSSEGAGTHVRIELPRAIEV